MTTIIIGGGITGRLAQLFAPDAIIYDWRTQADGNKLTRMYGANYLWEEIPEVVCAPFPVLTHVDWRRPELFSIQRYKEKVGKGDEVKTEWGLQFEEHSTGYEILSMPAARITFEARAVSIDVKEHTVVVQFGAEPGCSLFATTR